MKQLPLFFNLEGRSCLVIGSDHAAWCKIELLLSVGADVHVNAKSLPPKMQKLLGKGVLSFSEKPITSVDNSSFSVVFIADCEAERAQALFDQCQQLGIPVNVVDQPALCSFTVPSIIDRNPLTIAIGSAGSSPVLARRLRSQVESLIPKAMGTLAKLMGQYRGAVAEHIPQPERRAFWDATLDGPIAQKVLDGKPLEAERLLAASIENRDPAATKPQRSVTVVDARHNNCELMTLQSVKELHRAEHILHAPSIDPEILRLARRDAYHHELQRLDQDLLLSPRKLSERVEELAQEGEHVVIIVSNPSWSKEIISSLCQRLQSTGISTRSLLSVEYKQRVLREVS